MKKQCIKTFKQIYNDPETKEKRERLTLFLTGAGDRKIEISEEQLANDLVQH